MKSTKLDLMTRLGKTKGPISPKVTRSISQLQKAVINEFLPRFCPDAKVILTKSKKGHLTKLDELLLGQLQMTFDTTDDVPDMVAYSQSKNWLYLIATDGGTGPMSNTRRRQLWNAARSSNAGLLFISVFANLTTFKRHIGDIGWDTDVWIKSEPSHSIHWGGRDILDLDVTTNAPIKTEPLVKVAL